jgi:hypothetical protein
MQDVQRAIVSVINDKTKPERTRKIARVVLVLLDHRADRLWNETEAAEVAADILATLECPL